MSIPANREPSLEQAIGCVGDTVLCVDSPVNPVGRVDAELVEQDTCFVLAARGPLYATRESYDKLVTRMVSQQGVRPGSVIVREGVQPVRIEAIVHDLDRDPSWRSEWIQTALCEALAYCERRELSALRLPVLGRVHGRASCADFVQALSRALLETHTAPLRAVWIQVNGQDLADLIAALRGTLAQALD